MADDLQLLMTLVSNGLLPALLVLAGVWFAVWRFWPWWTVRDQEQRTRNYEIDLSHATGMSNMADATRQLAAAIEKCTERL